MAWRDRLLRASFRSVAFGIDEHSAAIGGRRVQTHEYPGRDDPWTEDLGRRTKRFTIEGWIVGDDYMARRDALIDACDAPGPGTLIHPYLGAREVLCEDCTVTERTSEGRMFRVTLAFVTAGRNRYPEHRADTRAAVNSAADAGVAAVAASAQQTIKVEGRPSYVATATADAVRTAADEIGTPAAGTLARSADTAVRDLGSLTEQVTNAVRTAPDDVIERLSQAGVPLPSVPRTTVHRAQQQVNQEAVSRLVRGNAVMERARRVATRTWQDRVSATDARDALFEVMDGFAAGA